MCTGTAGAVTIASVTVGGVLVNVGVHPGPNTTVTVAGITLVFNEESPVPSADQGLTVNALHIKAAPIGLGLLDVTIASATSDTRDPSRRPAPEPHRPPTPAAAAPFAVDVDVDVDATVR